MKPPRIRFARLLWIAALVFQAAWYILLWTRFAASPELKGADFISLYTAGMIVRSDQAARVYDLQFQHDLQQDIRGVQAGPAEFLPFLHPPFLLPLQAWMAEEDYADSYQRWTWVLLAFLAVSAGVLWRLLRGWGWDRKMRAVAVLSAILFYPVFISILKGQDTVFLLTAVLIWYVGLERDQDWLAGLGLALALIRPQIVLLLALPFLFKGRKVFGWFCLGAGALAFYSLLLLGWDGVQGWITTLMVSARGEGYGLNQAGMFNLIGLILRLAPGLDLGLVHALGWGFYALALVGLCILWAYSRLSREQYMILAVTLSLFAAPHLHYHDLALLLLPLLGLGSAAARASRLTVRMAAALPLMASVVLLLADLWEPARSVLPFTLMAALPLLTWRMGKNAFGNSV